MNPIMAALRGDHLPRPRRAAATPTQPPVQERKMYLYPDYINPSIATSPDVYSAIRMGTLVHGPGATEMTYRAWHHEDNNSAVFACLSAICTAYPEAPAKVYLETDVGERDEQPEHPLKELLDNPNPYLPREHVLHYTQWSKHVNGNAYWRKIRSRGPGSNVVALWPISPMRIQPVTTKEDALNGIFISWYEYVFDPAQDPERISPDDMVHFRLGLDDKDHRLGAAPLARVMREVLGDDEAHKWQQSMLENGGTVGMLIQVPIDSSITVDQAEDMKSRFEERFGGDNRGRTGVLMGGAKAEPYGFAPDQMDMKSLHRIPEERIAAVLRVPAIIAGLGAGLDRSTYANFREAREMFAEMTLMPLYAFDAATLNMQLKPEFSSDPRLKIDFDVTNLRAFQEDEDQKWKRLDTAVKTGWVRPNEARTDVGLPPDMDELEAPMAQMFGMRPGSRDEQEEPAGRKQIQRRKVPTQRQLNRMADVLQALVDIGQPGLQEDLDEYFEGQQQRVTSNLTRG